MSLVTAEPESIHQFASISMTAEVQFVRLRKQWQEFTYQGAGLVAYVERRNAFRQDSDTVLIGY